MGVGDGPCGDRIGLQPRRADPRLRRRAARHGRALPAGGHGLRRERRGLLHPTHGGPSAAGAGRRSAGVVPRLRDDVQHAHRSHRDVPGGRGQPRGGGRPSRSRRRRVDVGRARRRPCRLGAVRGRGQPGAGAVPPVGHLHVRQEDAVSRRPRVRAAHPSHARRPRPENEQSRLRRSRFLPAAHGPHPPRARGDQRARPGGRAARGPR